MRFNHTICIQHIFLYLLISMTASRILCTMAFTATNGRVAHKSMFGCRTLIGLVNERTTSMNKKTLSFQPRRDYGSFTTLPVPALRSLVCNDHQSSKTMYFSNSSSHLGSIKNEREKHIERCDEKKTSRCVGEKVQVEIEGCWHDGIVKERKRGWYTVEVRIYAPSQTEKSYTGTKSSTYNIVSVKRRYRDMIEIKAVGITVPSISKISERTEDDNEPSKVNNTNISSIPFNQKVEEVPNTQIPDVSEYSRNVGKRTKLLPVSPAIVDLDQLTLSRKNHGDVVLNRVDQNLFEQCAHFRTIDKWVLFSDLHCSPSSLATCLTILSTVHEAAKERGAGVIFLGDFWHHRGTIRVDCLNSILNALSDWEVPMIMIPGNHDQVTLSGSEHSLTPFRNAYFLDNSNTTGKPIPGILIFSEPTKFLNSLFIPHIRDISMMQSILQSPTAQKLSLSETPTALFVHADVKGAYMNENIISTGGISPSYFPHSVPVYSGHFHKPHTIIQGGGIGKVNVDLPASSHDDSKEEKNINSINLINKEKGRYIRYVGSPYETSLSEAGQRKALLYLDSKAGWLYKSSIPINVGRRHWKINGMQEFLDMKFSSNSDTVIDDSQVVCGDRVVISVSQDELEEARKCFYTSGPIDMNLDVHGELNKPTDSKVEVSEFDKRVNSFRSLGITVEVREVKTLSKMPMTELGTGINKYLGNAETGDDTTTEISSDSSWISIEDMTPSSILPSYLYHEVQRESMKNSTASILLEAGIALFDNIGLNSPAEEVDRSSRVSIDLQLEAVSLQGFGSFKDPILYPLKNRGLVLLRGSNRDGGSDSNGSGKTTLAMSTLWALTGSTDPKPTADGKVSDIVNDQSKSARVSIQGLINQRPFVISRSKSISKGSLTFHIDGQDLTRQSVKETQAVINEKLGATPELLARTMFHGQHSINGLLESTDSKFKEELSLIVNLSIWQRLAGIARTNVRDMAKLASEVDGKISIRKNDMSILSDRCKTSKKTMELKDEIVKSKDIEIQSKMKALRESIDIEVNLENIQLELDKVTKKIKIFEGLLEFKAIEQDIINLLSEMQRSHDDINRYDRELALAEDNLSITKSKWKIQDLSQSNVNDIIQSTCPTCQRPVNVKDEKSRDILRKEMIESVNVGVINIKAIEKRNRRESEILNKKVLTKIELQKSLNKYSFNLEENNIMKDKSLLQIKTNISQLRQEQTKQSDEYSNGMKHLQNVNRINEIRASYEAELKQHHHNLAMSQSTYESFNGELGNIKGNLKNMEVEKQLLKNKKNDMSKLADCFGQKGVQTYILQNVIYALQMSSQTFLDELSDHSLRINLSIDASDKITRTVDVLSPKGGTWIQRSLSSLSGGQWRRCSLALSLGFSDLVARRGRLQSSLLVLDEPLTHLDSSGRDNVGKLLRKMVNTSPTHEQDKNLGFCSSGKSTILIILQDLAAYELDENFDCMDEVIKYDGHSKVRIE